MNQRRRLLNVDIQKQKILRELARLDGLVISWLHQLEKHRSGVCKKGSPLYQSLEQVRLEIYRSGCEVLGMKSDSQTSSDKE